MRIECCPCRSPYAKVIVAFCVVDETQLPQCGGLNIRRKPPASSAFPDRRRLGIAKVNDHRIQYNA
jgi:hypothetical protein